MMGFWKENGMPRESDAHTTDGRMDRPTKLCLVRDVGGCDLPLDLFNRGYVRAHGSTRIEKKINE